MKAKTIEELRDKFFEECVSENTGGYKVINYAPHDLFEWIKENIVQPEPQKGSDVALIINELEKRIDYLKNNVTEHNIVRQVDLESILNFAHSLPLVSEPKQVTEEEIAIEQNKDLLKAWREYSPNTKTMDFIPNEFIIGHTYGFTNGIRKGLSLKEPKEQVTDREIEMMALEIYPVDRRPIFTKKDLVDINKERRIIYIDGIRKGLSLKNKQ